MGHIQIVGWVEPQAKPNAIPAASTLGFASLNPTYAPARPEV